MGDKWDQFGPDYDHPPFQGQPRTYLLASTARSGSHFLGHLLLGTGVLGSPLEYFHAPHAKKWMASLGVEDFPAMLRRLYVALRMVRGQGALAAIRADRAQ